MKNLIKFNLMVYLCFGSLILPFQLQAQKSKQIETRLKIKDILSSDIKKSLESALPAGYYYFSIKVSSKSLQSEKSVPYFPGQTNRENTNKITRSSIQRYIKMISVLVTFDKSIGSKQRQNIKKLLFQELDYIPKNKINLKEEIAQIRIKEKVKKNNNQKEQNKILQLEQQLITKNSQISRLENNIDAKNEIQKKSKEENTKLQQQLTKTEQELQTIKSGKFDSWGSFLKVNFIEILKITAWLLSLIIALVVCWFVLSKISDLVRNFTKMMQSIFEQKQNDSPKKVLKSGSNINPTKKESKESRQLKTHANLDSLLKHKNNLVQKIETLTKENDVHLLEYIVGGLYSNEKKQQFKAVLILESFQIEKTSEYYHQFSEDIQFKITTILDSNNPHKNILAVEALEEVISYITIATLDAYNNQKDPLLRKNLLKSNQKNLEEFCKKSPAHYTERILSYLAPQRAALLLEELMNSEDFNFSNKDTQQDMSLLHSDLDTNILASYENFISNKENEANETQLRHYLKIIDELKQPSVEKMMDYIATENPKLGHKLQRHVVIFSDCLRLENESIERIYSELSNIQVALWIQEAPELFEKISSFMTSNRKAMIEHEYKKASQKKGKSLSIQSKVIREEITNIMKNLKNSDELFLIEPNIQHDLNRHKKDQETLVNETTRLKMTEDLEQTQPVNEENNFDDVI